MFHKSDVGAVTALEPARWRSLTTVWYRWSHRQTNSQKTEAAFQPSCRYFSSCLETDVCLWDEFELLWVSSPLLLVDLSLYQLMKSIVTCWQEPSMCWQKICDQRNQLIPSLPCGSWRDVKMWLAVKQLLFLCQLSVLTIWSLWCEP